MPQVTLSDFEQRVYGRLDGNTALYPQVDVDRLINEASRNLNLFTGFNQGRVAVGFTVAGWQWYRVPAPICFPMRAYLENKLLYKTSASAISDTAPRWMRGAALRKTSSWVPVGVTMFGIVDPDPTGGKFLEMWGTLTPALLVNPTDGLSLDDEYSALIVEYAFMNLVLKEGGKPFTDASGAFKSWLKRARDLQHWEMKINPNYWVEVESKVETPA